ncbi:MAG: hypothetical protein QOH91_3912 [Mycobacterium sp.]|nr:hypothetical protein [Mycobacterium sp.]
MNRFKIRLPAVAVIGLVALIAPALSGCSAGQVAQTAMQEPAVNGNRLTVNNEALHQKVELRDIRIQASQTTAWIETGQTVELALVAVNQSPDEPDRLMEVTSEIGKVAITGDPRLPPSGMLFVGTPDGQRVAPGPLGSSNAAKAVVTLTQKITNGQLYEFTFNFEKAGTGHVQVPISAGVLPPPRVLTALGGGNRG